MNKFLIFRTDRIGDYIFSRILTESIKANNPKSIIDVVCSSYNSTYIKNFKDVNKIYILDKYNLVLMIKNLTLINKVKYDYIIILDGKRRSVFFSLLLKSKKKYAILKDFRPRLLLKLFFDSFFINSEVNTQYDNFSSVINYLNIKVPDSIDYYNGYLFKKKCNFKLPKKYSLLHLDEKWFEGHYYKDFNYMNLNPKNFILLINTIIKKFNNDIVITTGKIDVDKFLKIRKHLFKKTKKNNFLCSLFKKKVLFFDNTDFRDLEFIVKNSNEVICCEGAISHVSNAFSKKTLALVNNFKTAKFWTNHMKNITLLKRDNINKIIKQINLLK